MAAALAIGRHDVMMTTTLKAAGFEFFIAFFGWSSRGFKRGAARRRNRRDLLTEPQSRWCVLSQSPS